MVNHVFNALEEDSRKGYFVTLTNNDRNYLHIDKTYLEIEDMTKQTWQEATKC